MLFDYLYQYISIDSFRKHLWLIIAVGFFTCVATLALAVWLLNHDVYVKGPNEVMGPSSFWELLTKK